MLRVCLYSASTYLQCSFCRAMLCINAAIAGMRCQTSTRLSRCTIYVCGPMCHCNSWCKIAHSRYYANATVIRRWHVEVNTAHNAVAYSSRFYHCLNDSPDSVNDDLQFLWKQTNFFSTPYKIPEPIDKKIGTINYVREGIAIPNLVLKNPSTRGFWADG